MSGGLGYRPGGDQEELDRPRGTTATARARLGDDGEVGEGADSGEYALQGGDDLARDAAARGQTERLFETQEREPDGGDGVSGAGESGDADRDDLLAVV